MVMNIAETGRHFPRRGFMFLSALALVAMHTHPARAQSSPALKNKERDPGFKSSPVVEQQVRLEPFSRGLKAGGAVSLTFDDGPHPKLTPALLKILKETGVPATFFMVGSQVEKYPKVAKKVVDEGFEIGNHSYSHANLSLLTRPEIEEELRKTQELIEKATGKRPTLFRPPYGGLNKDVYDAARSENLDVVTWSVDPRDWESRSNPAQIRSRIKDHAAAGTIIILHDIHAETIEAMPGVIRMLKEAGWKLTTAGALLGEAKEFRSRAGAEQKVALPDPSRGESTGAERVIRIPLSGTSLNRYKSVNP